MRVTYDVPEDLEEKFQGKTQKEINQLLTQALYNSSIELVQNMCFDILHKVSTLQQVQITGEKLVSSMPVTNTEQAQQQTEEKKDKPVASKAATKATKAQKSKLGKKFLSGMLK